MTASSRESVVEQEAMRAAITGVSHHIDHRRWPELRELFADTVVVDYTSLFGGEVQNQKGDDLIAGWRTALTPVPVTQHFLGPIDVVIHGDTASAECHVRAHHVRRGLPGGDEWMVAGHYVFELAKDQTAWKIRKMKLETSYQTGNTKLLAEAAAAQEAGSRKP
jgi:hypothetical protein